MRYISSILQLFLVVVSVCAAAQDMSKPQAQAQCKFSDGKKITVTDSSEHGNYRLTTEGELVTVKGLTVPAGDYTLIRGWDREDHYFLTMRRQAEEGPSRDLPRLPLSVTTSAVPAGGFGISFDQTGGSCKLHWTSEKTNTLLSLEFTEKNADLPVLQ